MPDFTTNRPDLLPEPCANCYGRVVSACANCPERDVLIGALTGNYDDPPMCRCTVGPEIGDDEPSECETCDSDNGLACRGCHVYEALSDAADENDVIDADNDTFGFTALPPRILDPSDPRTLDIWHRPLPPSDDLVPDDDDPLAAGAITDIALVAGVYERNYPDIDKRLTRGMAEYQAKIAADPRPGDVAVDADGTEYHVLLLLDEHRILIGCDGQSERITGDEWWRMSSHMEVTRP